MGTKYTATLNVQCLKKHTCVSCESKFSYLLTRDIKAEGTTEQVALDNATNMATKSMINDVDFHPCPSCGVLQPEMTADVKSGWFMFGIWVALIVIAIAFVCGLTQGMRISTSAYMALAGVMVTCLSYFRGAIYNPNTNLQANLAKAQLSIDSKQLIIDETKPANETIPHAKIAGFQTGNLKGFMFCGLALLAFSAPVLFSAINGWHQNDSSYPAVIGAGDESTFFFDQKITSLKGYWRGRETRVTVTNAQELDLPDIAINGKTKESNWGGSISGKSLSNNSNRMWVQIKLLPGVTEIEGKTVHYDLGVVAEFPYAMAGGFAEKEESFQHTTSAVYSSPGAGASYYNSWLYGQVVGLILIITGNLCHFGAASALRKRGNPTEVITLGQAIEEDLAEDDFTGDGPTDS